MGQKNTVLEHHKEKCLLSQLEEYHVELLEELHRYKAACAMTQSREAHVTARLESLGDGAFLRSLHDTFALVTVRSGPSGKVVAQVEVPLTVAKQYEEKNPPRCSCAREATIVRAVMGALGKWIGSNDATRQVSSPMDVDVFSPSEWRLYLPNSMEPVTWTTAASQANCATLDLVLNYPSSASLGFRWCGQFSKELVPPSDDNIWCNARVCFNIACWLDIRSLSRLAACCQSIFRTLFLEGGQYTWCERFQQRTCRGGAAANKTGLDVKNRNEGSTLKDEKVEKEQGLQQLAPQGELFQLRLEHCFVLLPADASIPSGSCEREKNSFSTWSTVQLTSSQLLMEKIPQVIDALRTVVSPTCVSHHSRIFGVGDGGPPVHHWKSSVGSAGGWCCIPIFSESVSPPHSLRAILRCEVSNELHSSVSQPWLRTPSKDSADTAMPLLLYVPQEISPEFMRSGAQVDSIPFRNGTTQRSLR